MIMARLKSHNGQEMQPVCGMGRSLYLGAIKSRLGQQAFCLTLEQGWVQIANSSYFGLDRNE